MSDLTTNAVEAAAELGAEATAALEYGLRPHLDALVAGTEAGSREQLVNYLRYFELTAARLKVTDHTDPLGRIERDFNTDPHIYAKVHDCESWRSWRNLTATNGMTNPAKVPPTLIEAFSNGRA